MKKTLAIILSLMLAATAVTSCGKKNKNQETQNSSQDNNVTEQGGSNNSSNDETVDTSTYTVQGIIDSIYAQKAPKFMYGTIPVDLTDKDSYTTYLGIEDISKIKEAAVSESMIGAQAFSLVVARVAEGEDAKAVAEEMKTGINNSKWVCVTADDVKVTTYGDLICFCMIDTDFKEDFTAQDAIDAFTNVVTGKAQYKELSFEDETDAEISDDELTDTDVTDGVTPDDENTETSPEENSGESEKNSDKKTETPVVNPETPEVKPETPEVKPETPEVKPETPEVKPETPEVKPETPEVKPETPEVKPETPEVKPETPEVKPETPTSNFTLQGIIDSIYAQKAPLFMFGSMPVDLNDEFSYNTYLGIKDPSKISEAIVSESMIGAQAYSLVIAKVTSGQDANAVATEMKAGIDNRKWVCVTADDVKVTTSGDYICFCMIDTEYKDAFTAQDAIDAFTAVMNGSAKYEEGAAPNIPGYEEPEIEEDYPDIDIDEDTAVVGASVLESIINDMYAIKAPQFMLGTIPVDLTDEFSYKTYLGTNDPSKFVEAVVSESMIGAQAYSLVVARVAPGVDANAIAEEMKAGIDNRKWICVEADDIKTAVVGDLICFCMIDTEYKDAYTAQDAIDAFISITAA